MSLNRENLQGTDAKRRFRQPAQILQPDEMACVSAITTQVVYMTGKISSPDVDSVDKALGRNPNQPAKSNDAHLLLLQAGLTTHAVCAFDEKQFLNEGLPYLQTYYGHQWTDEHDITFPLAEIEKINRNARGIWRRLTGILIYTQGKPGHQLWMILQH